MHRCSTQASVLWLGKKRVGAPRGVYHPSPRTLDEKRILESKNVYKKANNRRTQNGPANRKGRLTLGHILAKIHFSFAQRNNTSTQDKRGQSKIN